eukprot:g7005.t1
MESNSAVITIKDLPHGFYEKQLLQFFSQFGTVEFVRVKRSRKSGLSCGIAYVQFQFEEVAEIAAKSMDQYTIFESTMKCSVKSAEWLKQRPDLFKDFNSADKIRERGRQEFSPDKDKRLNRRKREAIRESSTSGSYEAYIKKCRTMVETDRKLSERLKAAGIDYEYPLLEITPEMEKEWKNEGALNSLTGAVVKENADNSRSNNSFTRIRTLKCTMRFIHSQFANDSKGKQLSNKREDQFGCFCGFLPLKKTQKKEVISVKEYKTVNKNTTPKKEAMTIEDANVEEFYTAKSFFCDRTVGSESDSELIRLKELDADTPAVIPQDAISALSLVPPFCAQIPSELKVAGAWKKDFKLSTPAPNEVEEIINASVFVQTVRRRIKDFEIQETPDTFSFIVKIPVPYYKPRVETFRKDGSVVKLPFRRDDRSGSSFGQAFALIDGRIVLRVWNLGASPELMMQDIFEFSNSTKMKVEQSIFTLDGERKAKKVTVAFKADD